MLRNTRSTLLTALVAALALSALAFAGVAGAQRGAARQANTNSGGGNKRVVVRSGETARGSRMTVTADDSFKDYSAYRSGDRFYVVLPKSAAGAARGGSGKGYSDMQVQQRGDSVVLSFRVQPGAKPRVQQQFNRLEVVLDVPEGAGQQQQQAVAPNEASRNQQQPAETRNQTPAAQQSNQTAVAPPNANPNSAAERAAAERAAEAARSQAANNTAPVPTAPPVLTAEQPATAVDPNAQPGATPSDATPQEGAATPENANVPAEQLAQAQPPASQAPVSITKPATAADSSGASLGAFLLRNWALTLIIALVVVGLGLVIAARRTPAATREPAGDADAEETVAADEPRATRAKEATAAALKQASATAEASIPLKASDTAEAAVPIEAAVPAKASVPTEASASVPAEASALEESSVPVETSTPEAAEVADVDAKPLAAATMLAGGAAAAKSRKQSRKEARQGAKKKKRGAHADSPADAEETLTAAPAVQGLVAEEREERQAEETVVEETAVAETIVEAPVFEASAETVVEESVVEETVVETPAVAETPAVEETGVEAFVAAPAAVEEFAVEETVVEEPAAEETAAAFGEVTPAEQAAEAASPVHTAEAPAFVEPSVEEVADISAAPEAGAAEHEVAAPEAPSYAAEETTVEAAAPSASTGIVPAVSEASAPEAPEPEVTEPDESKALAPVADIEPAVAPEPERVQAATRALLEGSYYDRSIIATRDPFSRQMIAAELLAALAGRNQQRRERAGTAFVKEGYFDETARDLREADAPAERSAAARSLALLGDRTATPHLIAALEDQNLDVRRAAVEALGSLRDPVAVEPLEALLERERNERNRIPPRVIRVAADACREGAPDIIATVAPAAPAAVTSQEPAVETARVTETAQVTETAIEPAHAAEVERPGVEVEPREEAATVEAESRAVAAPEAEVTEAAEPAEVAAREPVEESPVSIAPFVGGQEQEPAPSAETLAEAQAETFFEAQDEPAKAGSTAFAEDSRAEEERGVEESAVEESAVEDEVTLVAEAPAHETRVDPFVADLTEELNAAAETQTFETAVAEPKAVADTGIEPFVDTDEYAVEVSRPAAESSQATLFGDDAAEEVTREVAPFRPAAPESPRTDASAGEWVDFDMGELSEEPRAASPEPTPAPPPAQEHVFEFSSGETFTSSPVEPPAEPNALDLPAAAPEQPPSFADARAEFSREVETFDAHAPEAAAPASSAEKGLAPFDEHSTVPASIQQRLASQDAGERAAAIIELSRVDSDEAFQQICAGFDDGSKEVRGAAARALYDLRADRADSFTRALREASPERRRQIGTAISSSGLAGESISQLTGESREKTYEAFSLLFLMAKAGEVQPLVRAIEGHPSNEVRLAVVKLLALSGQKEILPAFRRLAVRGSLPTEVRSAVMEAIYQISSSQPTHA